MSTEEMGMFESGECCLSFAVRNEFEEGESTSFLIQFSGQSD